MINQKLAFIGGGNMANAIIGGLLTADNLEKNFNVKTTDDNNITVTAPNTVLILAVKPQVMKSVAEGIAKMVQTHKPLIITIAAGITLPDLSRWLLKDSIDNHPPSLIRCMPNTPALVGQGATGLYAEAGVTESQKNIAFTILKSVSKSTYWVDKESLLDVVTGVSEALEQAGIDLGLPADVARGLAAQTCLGAGSMLTTSTDSPAELRRKVTSPNGTTEAAVKSLEAGGVRELFANAVKAATNRGEELGRILGSQFSLLFYRIMNIPSKKGRYSPEATATLLKLYLQGVDRPNRAQREQLGLELNKTPRNSSSIPHIITNIHSTDSNHSPSVSPSDNLSSLDVSNVNSPVTNTPLMDSALPSNSTISPVKSEFNYPIILDTNLKSPTESNIPINHSLSHMSPSSTVSVLNSPKLNSNLSSPKVKSNLSSPSKLSQNTLNSPSMSQEIQSQTTLSNSQPNLSTHYISNSQQPQVASLSIPLRPNTASHFPVSLSPVENIPSPLSMLLYPLIFLLDTTRPQNFQFVPSSIQVHTLPPNTQLFHGHSHTQQNPNIVQQSITLNQNTTFNNITQSFNMNLNQNTNNFRNPMTPPLNYNVTPIQSFFVPSGTYFNRSNL
ncbi:hypothetical protein HDV02_003555 [Globomyces sp. JEL0801]|nr:hypothetical protein HDV02_003555 [Globomyces sp. JEL0801]